MTEGTLVRWLKNKGDTVAAGDVLAEVETDKATMEMPAFDEGVLAEIYVQAGGKAAVGQKLALLLAAGEKAPEGGAPPPAPRRESRGPSRAIRRCAPQRKVLRPLPPRPPGMPHPQLLLRLADVTKFHRLRRRSRLQRESISAPSPAQGPGSRIIARDVESAVPRAGGVAPAAPAAVRAMPAGENDQRIPLSGMRKVIAERLVVSKTTVPCIFT